jgi:hypothetical protein
VFENRKKVLQKGVDITSDIVFILRLGSTVRKARTDGLFQVHNGSRVGPVVRVVAECFFSGAATVSSRSERCRDGGVLVESAGIDGADG